MKFNPSYKTNMLLIGFKAEFEDLDTDTNVSQNYKLYLDQFDEILERKSITLKEIGFGADWYVVCMEIYITLSFGKNLIENYNVYKEFFKRLFCKIESLLSDDKRKIERINYNTAISIVLGRLAMENISIEKIEVSSTSIIPKFGGEYRSPTDNDYGYDRIDFGKMDFNIILKVNEALWINSIVENNGKIAYFKISRSLSMHDDFTSEYDELFE